MKKIIFFVEEFFISLHYCICSINPNKIDSIKVPAGFEVYINLLYLKWRAHIKCCNLILIDCWKILNKYDFKSFDMMNIEYEDMNLKIGIIFVYHYLPTLLIQLKILSICLLILS